MREKPVPTRQENEAAIERLKVLDRLAPKCAWHKHLCECDAQERAARGRYNAVMDVQNEYETKYC